MNENGSENIARVRRLFETRSRHYAAESASIWDPSLIDPLLDGIGGSDRVLDLCCGPGPVGRRILELGLCQTVVAGDLLQSFLTNLPSDLPAVCLDAHRLPFMDNSFDVVTVRQGFHYCNPVLVTEEITRVASRHVAVGNVVMDQGQDTPFWRDYASIVTPGRSVFLRRGQIAALFRQHSACITSTCYEWGQGEVSSSVAHLDKRAQLEAVEVFRRQPDSIVERYNIEFEGSKIWYKVPWEFTLVTLFNNTI